VELSGKIERIREAAAGIADNETKQHQQLIDDLKVPVIYSDEAAA
jgi:hypothetical protein